MAHGTIPASSDVVATGGRLRLRDHGGGGRLVLCVPGLSANATSFDFLGERLHGPGHHVVSVDLRGRGFSEVTPPGTYGWPSHARDVLDVAATLGDEPFDLVGHSMGAYVAMAAVRTAPERVRRLVLIDGLGTPEAAALPPIRAGLERLGTVFPSAGAFVAMVRAVGVVEPWSEYWDRYFTYDLEPVDGGVRSRTDRDAVMEDYRWGDDHRQHDLWPEEGRPVLLVTARRPIGDGGYIVRASDRDEFLRRRGARGVEVDANHYAIANDPATVEAVRAFLEEPE